MAKEDKKQEETPKKDDRKPERYHNALISINVGSKADGTAKQVIIKGDRLTLSDEEVESYRSHKIIE